VHKPLFGHPVGADLGAACLFFLISGLALSAGIGGGGLYVPLLMIILGFQVHEATAISQPCLAGGAASALIYNVRQRHPSGLKPMIDYDLVLIMGPNLLVGAMVGSFLNFALPSWLILGMLVAILSHSVFKTFKKALETLRKERAGEVRGLKPNSDARLSKNPIERCLKFVGLSKRYAEFEDPAASLPPAVVGHRTEVDAGQIKLDLQDSLEKDPEGQIITAKMTREPSLDTAQTQQSAQSQLPEPQYPRSKLIGFLLMWVVLVCSILFRGGSWHRGCVLEHVLGHRCSHCSAARHPQHVLFRQCHSHGGRASSCGPSAASGGCDPMDVANRSVRLCMVALRGHACSPVWYRRWHDHGS